MPGTLFIVGTPIGNLEDLTFRALRTLKEVNLIAAEDTRRTSRLLAHYEVRKPLVSIREHNEAHAAARLVQRLEQGEHVAYVTDAGSPGIADPGARLVAAARTAGINVVPIPGASAVATAVSVSGFPSDEFAFMGFPPRSGSARQEWLDRLAQDPRLLVFFEAPHRIRQTLSDVASKLVQRPILVFREITKIHESLVIMSGTVPNIQDMERGEITVVVSPAHSAQQAFFEPAAAVDMFGRLTNLAGFSEETAINVASRLLSVAPSSVRNAVKKHRISVKQRSASLP